MTLATANATALIPTPRRRPTYAQRVHHLSVASVRKHFDAYGDIAWDAPENAIDPGDPRWQLRADNPLGATAWYRGLPEIRRARIGLDVVATQMKVGLQFEQLLGRGLLELASTLPDEGPELRYVLHELIEEAQHILMFSEFVRRTGLRIQGMTPFELRASRSVPRLGRTLPEQFFFHVLAGEFPIDHVQRTALRDSADMHPLLRRVLRIHVTEEARHVSFADAFLRERVPRLSRIRRAWMMLRVPIILRMTADQILRPTRALLWRHDVPTEVIGDVMIDSPELRRLRIDGLRPVRDIARELGLVPRALVPLWRRLGIWDDQANDAAAIA